MISRLPPAEIVASLLAATTVIISLPPLNLPPWAIFISWAGTFAAGGPTANVMRRIWPPMPVGSTFAMLIALAFEQASQHYAGTALVIAQMTILFVLNTCLMCIARLPIFSFIPGMFFGFASYFATLFGGFGPVPHNPFVAWVAVVPMNALGPVYAWLTQKLSRGSHEATSRG
jgi:Protein of unknown function (DUF1097)